MAHKYNYLRPAQVADRLNVSPKTISRWIKEGKVKHTRTLGGAIGRGHARIAPEEADRLEELMRITGSDGLESALEQQT